MANGHGGYRRPANPAPVSGPGAHSKRTDGKQPIVDLPDAAYGENAQFTADQQGAPVPQAPGPPGPSAPAGGAPPVVGFGEPTQDPNTPVTDGAAYGPGAGAEALGLPNPNTEDRDYFKRYLPFLISIADKSDTPPSVKRFVREIISRSG